jgi:hypothetical protein
MLSTLLLRVSSLVLHSVMGGMAVFCLVYACYISDPDLVRYLIGEALKWGLSAAVILYCQCRYLDE